MARTQINYKNIKNKSLTGASFIDGLNVFDETKNYNEGDIVFWKGQWYKVVQAITGLQEGDLSNSPDNNSASYKKFEPLTISRTEVELNAGASTIIPNSINPNSNPIIITNLKHAPVSNVNEDLSYISSGDSMWNYDPLYIKIDTTIRETRAVNETSSAKENNLYFAFDLNKDQYKDIIMLSAF